MFRYTFKNKNNNDILAFLKAEKLSASDEVYAEIYQDEQGEFHLLGAMEERPANTTIYSLSKERYFEFHHQFNPTVEPDADYEKAINSATNEAHTKIILAARAILAKNNQDDALTAIERHLAELNLQDQLLQDYLLKLPRKILETIANLPAPEPHELSEKKVSAIQAVQDAIWIAQSTVTDDALRYAGTKATTALAASTKVIGVAFGIVSGALMGIGCGILSAKIYENRAVKSFTEKKGRAPSEEELKLIQRDAKHVGHSVFYGMTFWSLFAGLMECSLEIAKVAANFHPAGLLVNVLISLAAGIGQAVGACTQHVAHEREKHAANWDQHKKSADFIKSVVKVAVTSFFTGFAWSMISNFVPGPLKHALKTGAEKVAKIFIKMTYRAVAAGLATFGIALIASKASSSTKSNTKTSLISLLRSKIQGKKPTPKENEDESRKNRHP